MIDPKIKADKPLLARWRLLNVEILIQLLLYVIFFIVILYGLVSGKYIQLIHPRYKYYLVFSLVLVGAMFVAQLPRLRQANLRPRMASYLWFLLPAFFFSFLMQPDLQGLALIRENGRGSGGFVELNNGQVTTPQTGFALGNTGVDEAEELPKIKGAIQIDHLHYAAWLLDLNQNPQKYVGKKYTYLARLDQPAAAKEDECLPGRPVMLCCAADTQSLGVPAKINEVVSPHLGTWVYVTGTIYMGRSLDPRFPKEQGPWLDVTDVQPAPTPSNIYAYYFGQVDLPEK